LVVGLYCSSFPLHILQLAKKLHPDANKDDPEAEKKFQEVTLAYEVYYCCFCLSYFPESNIYLKYSYPKLTDCRHISILMFVGFEGWGKTSTV